MLRSRHAWEGESLELMGWMRRRGILELIVVLPDGSHLMLPAAWTDLQSAPEPAARGAVGSLMDLLAARRVLDGLLERVVLAERDDHAEEIDRAVASGVGGEPGARGGVVGAGRRGAPSGRDVGAVGDDRPDGCGPRRGHGR